jgi:hypothetical protein
VTRINIEAAGFLNPVKKLVASSFEGGFLNPVKKLVVQQF